MKNSWVDFREVKAAVSMEMVLANYGIMLRRLDGTYLRGRCPLPEHQSKSSHQSFIVNTQKNAWACHSSSCVAGRAGRLGGNVLDFVASMEGCTIREAALKLQDWFALAPDSSPPGKARREPAVAHTTSPAETADNGPLSFVLRHIDLSHPYLSERGVHPETARLFGIGYNRGTGTMQNRIVIPIHNEDGVLVAYAGRSLVDSTRAKYRFPQPLPQVPRALQSQPCIWLRQERDCGRRFLRLPEGSPSRIPLCGRTDGLLALTPARGVAQAALSRCRPPTRR